MIITEYDMCPLVQRKSLARYFYRSGITEIDLHQRLVLIIKYPETFGISISIGTLDDAAVTRAGIGCVLDPKSNTDVGWLNRRIGQNTHAPLPGKRQCMGPCRPVSCIDSVTDGAIVT